MALKKPGELFGKEVKDQTPSISVDESFPHIKEEFHKVEDLRKQLDNVSSNLNNSLTEVVNKNLNFLSNEYSDLLEKFNNKINVFKEEINNKVEDLEKCDQYLKAEIQVVEQRQQTINLNRIKKEVISEVQNILSGNVTDNIRRLEEKIEVVKDSYKQTLTESYNEPPNVKNSDPLTPLDQKFVSLDDFQKHYNLFLTRIQRQLSTLGGGGAVLVSDLDDVETSTAKVDNKFLKYNAAKGKWVGSDTAGGGYTLPIATAGVLGGIKVGSRLTIDSSTGVLSADVQGGGTGIGTNGSVNTTGIITASSFVGDGSGLTGITASGSGIIIKHDGSTVGTAGTINFSTNLDVSAISAGIVTVTASGSGINTANVSTSTLNVTGVSTFVGVTSFMSDVKLIGNQNLMINDALDFRGNNGGNGFITNSIGNLFITSIGDLTNYTGDNFDVFTNHDELAIRATKNGSVALYHDGGNKKFETTGVGATVTGTLSATSFSGGGANITGISTLNITNYGVGLGGGGGISNVVEDTSPQLGGNLDIQSREINTSASNGNIKLNPNGTGCVEIMGDGTSSGTVGAIQLNCSVNSHGVKIQSPPHSAGATYTLTLPNNDGGAGEFLRSNGSGVLSWASAGGLSSRTTTSASTGSIAQTASANITIPTAGKSFSLLKVAISAPAYVVLYVDSASRSSDSSRSEGTDPAPGAGVLTEVSTTTSGASTFLMSPAVLGWNNDSTPASQIYAKVVNKRATSGSNAITVTLTSVALEA